MPEAVSDDVALFAADVMGTGYNAVAESGVAPGDSLAVLGLGPVGLCAAQVAVAAGIAPVLAIDSVDQRLAMARRFGAVAIHRREDNSREVVRRLTGGRGVDGSIDAVGHPDALDLAIRPARKAGTVVATGVYAEACQVHIRVVWVKALRTGHADVIGHIDRVLGMLARGLDAGPPAACHPPPAARRRGRGVPDL